MALVSTQKLPNYSTTSTRKKLTLPQDVARKIPMLFPAELKNAGRAELIMFLEGPNEGPFVVTASLQKHRKKGGNGVRVVLLESGWKPVARELKLKKGDTVSIFLLDKSGWRWNYSIEVKRAPEADRVDVAIGPTDEHVVLGERKFNMNEPAQPNMEIINLNQPTQPVRMEFDLNEPAQPNMGMINLINQQNQLVRMEFDLNEPAHPNMEISF